MRGTFGELQLWRCRRLRRSIFFLFFFFHCRSCRFSYLLVNDEFRGSPRRREFRGRDIGAILENLLQLPRCSAGSIKTPRRVDDRVFNIFSIPSPGTRFNRNEVRTNLLSPSISPLLSHCSPEFRIISGGERKLPFLSLTSCF